MFGNENTADFVALANRISGKDLSGLFNTWLFVKARPPNLPDQPGGNSSSAQSAVSVPRPHERHN
jgi:aminopeptidase N